MVIRHHCCLSTPKVPPRRRLRQRQAGMELGWLEDHLVGDHADCSSKYGYPACIMTRAALWQSILGDGEVPTAKDIQ